MVHPVPPCWPLEATHARLCGIQDTLQLTIGHHRVEGKQVQLKKPLAILHKSPAAGPDGVAYEVVGVIRSKYQCVSHALACYLVCCSCLLTPSRPHNQLQDAPACAYQRA